MGKRLSQEKEEVISSKKIYKLYNLTYSEIKLIAPEIEKKINANIYTSEMEVLIMKETFIKK